MTRLDGVEAPTDGMRVNRIGQEILHLRCYLRRPRSAPRWLISPSWMVLLKLLKKLPKKLLKKMANLLIP